MLWAISPAVSLQIVAVRDIGRRAGRFSDSQRRTFERRVRAWRAARGPNREVMFPQVHAPGEFRAKYRDLLDYYRVDPQRINVRRAHENGDVESSHGHLKTVIEQGLLLRGSRDFSSREEYEAFLSEVVDKRNASRSPRFEQEQEVLGELPPTKLDYRTQARPVKRTSDDELPSMTSKTPGSVTKACGPSS